MCVTSVDTFPKLNGPKTIIWNPNMMSLLSKFVIYVPMFVLHNKPSRNTWLSSMGLEKWSTSVNNVDSNSFLWQTWIITKELVTPKINSIVVNSVPKHFGPNPTWDLMSKLCMNNTNQTNVTCVLKLICTNVTWSNIRLMCIIANFFLFLLFQVCWKNLK